MSCIACERYEKRITNIFRDEDLKMKYTELTGLQIFHDSFICDDCNDRLESSHLFRQNCIEVYQRISGNLSSNFSADPDEEIIDRFEDNSADDNEQKMIFVINDTGEEMGVVEEDPDKSYLDDKDDENQFEQTNDDENFDFLDFEAEQEEINMKTPKLDTSTNRKSYTVEAKLNIIKFAEENNNRSAARHFQINESSVRCFRRQKEILLTMNPNKKSNRKAFPHWPKLEEELKKFVLSQNESSLKLKEVREKALEIAEKFEIENFSGSNSYIFKFMQRHKIPTSSPRPRRIKQETFRKTMKTLNDKINSKNL